MNWIRWNEVTHIYEISTNDGAAWNPLSLSATILNEGTLPESRFQTRGSWVPADASGAGLAITIVSARKLKTARKAFVSFDIVYPVTASGAAAKISGLPFMSGSGQGGLVVAYNPCAFYISVLLRNGATQVEFFKLGGVAVINSELSGKNIVVAGTYEEV